MVAIKKNWVCTDPDCVQFRREAPERGSSNVFELAQVNQYGSSLFRVAHGFVYLNDDVDGRERESLCEMYGWATKPSTAPNSTEFWLRRFSRPLLQSMTHRKSTKLSKTQLWQLVGSSALM